MNECILISGKNIKEMPGSVASGTNCISLGSQLWNIMIYILLSRSGNKSQTQAKKMNKPTKHILENIHS